MQLIANKKILITGGAGAIGTNLVRRLVDDNDVTVIDNLSSGRLENIEDLECRLFICDIRDNDKLANIFKDRYDIVIHLAAHFANQNSIDFPATDLNVNIRGTLNLLQQSLKCQPRFVFASSSCVYGARNESLQEDMVTQDMDTPYAIGKYAGELYCRFFAKHYGMEVVSLRLFNNFGPYDVPGRYRNVIPNFILRAIRGVDLPITGTGEETRDFNYCDNTTDAFIRAASIDLDPGSDNVFNVGTGQEIRIIDLATRIKDLTGSSSKIVIVGQRDWDHISRRCADISAIREKLGYEPRVSFEDGLERTVSWFIEQDWGAADSMEPSKSTLTTSIVV